MCLQASTKASAAPAARSVRAAVSSGTQTPEAAVQQEDEYIEVSASHIMGHDVGGQSKEK